MWSVTLELDKVTLKIKSTTHSVSRNLFNVIGQGILTDHIHVWPLSFWDVTRRKLVLR